MHYCHLKLRDFKKVTSTTNPKDAVSLLQKLYHDYKEYNLAREWGEIILDWETLQHDRLKEELLSNIYYTLIYVYARLKNEEQANFFLYKLISLSGNREKVIYENIALELFNAKCYALALKCLDVYANFDRAQKHLQWLYNLKGCCHADAGNHAKGISYFQKSYEIFHWVVSYSNLIRCYIQLDEHENALRVFDEIVDFNPYYCWSYYLISPYYIKTNNPEQAIELLNKAVSLGFNVDEIIKDPELESVAEVFKKAP